MTVQKKVYPGYVLVEMILDPDSWFVVRNTPGVTSFVGGGNIPGSRNEPVPLEEHEVKQILRQMGVETPKYRVAFQKGQSVRVTDGPFAEFIGTVDEINPGAQQDQGPRQHLRPRDAGRARLPPSREAVSTSPAAHRGVVLRRSEQSLTLQLPWAGTVLTLQLPAGAATPAPPVGTALGPHGINIVEFTKSYNEKTQDKRGQIIPAQITIYEDRSFSFILKTPPAADLLRKAAGVDKGAATTGREKVGKVTRSQIREIAESQDGRSQRHRHRGRLEDRRGHGALDGHRGRRLTTHPRSTGRGGTHTPRQRGEAS